jgi:hypothetical protein
MIRYKDLSLWLKIAAVTSWFALGSLLLMLISTFFYALIFE